MSVCVLLLVKDTMDSCILKELKVIQCSQKLNATTTLTTSDGKQLRTTSNKLDRWHKYFKQVSNVCVELEESALDLVLAPCLEMSQATTNDVSLTFMPST